MENQPKQQFQRKTIIIKRNLQYRYMFIISFTSVVAFMLVVLDIIWNIYKVVERHPGMLPLLEEIFASAPLMMFKLVIYILIVIIASAVISHKIAGPIYKFEKTCDKIAEGDLTQRVFLRKGDALLELQSSFNNMIQKINEIFKINEELKQSLKQKNIAVNDIEEADKKIKNIFPQLKL
ncbi:MAG: hypothetical protein N2Z20_00605 [Elusimicrobiales bacterium]|nr:hypothetical protein [Elusimicrobiales bacterium]